MPLYRITWKTDTGLEGHGDFCCSYELAEAWLEYLQKKYNTMTHRIEAYTPAL